MSFTFKEFLLNEQQAYLAQKVGNILSAIQDLKNDAKTMGSRNLNSFSNEIVVHIRNILHSSWPREQEKHLKNLQKMAVAIMKCMDEKGDLPTMISSVAASMEKLVGDLGMPVNKLVPTEPAKDTSEDDKATAATQTKQKQNQPAPEGEVASTASGKPPAAADTMQTAPQATPPAGGTGQDMAAPPLGGSTGTLDAM